MQNREKVRMSKLRKYANTDDRVRMRNFKRANLLGAIFICSCCKRRLYENAVMKITKNLKLKIEEKKPDLFDICLKRQVLINITINDQNDRTGSYICTTCKDSMLSGRVPAMAEINGLQLVTISLLWLSRIL